MARNKTAVDKAVERLAKEIAKEHFEFALEIYEEEAEVHADEGTCLLRSWRARSWARATEELVDLAGQEYQRLVKAKYKRIK